MYLYPHVKCHRVVDWKCQSTLQVVRLRVGKAIYGKIAFPRKNISQQFIELVIYSSIFSP